MGKLRWKRDKAPTGLSAVGAGPRGYIYHDGDIMYAVVSPLIVRHAGGVAGWYWVAGWDSDVPYRNTCDAPVDSRDKAKVAAARYVKRQLEKLKQVSKAEPDNKDNNGQIIASKVETAFIFAARYAHNRKTGAGLVAVNAINYAWDSLSNAARRQILKESHEAQYDLDVWEEFRKEHKQ